MNPTQTLTFPLNKPLTSKITIAAVIGLITSLMTASGLDFAGVLALLKPYLPPALYAVIWFSRVFFTKKIANSVTGASRETTNSTLYLLNSPLTSKIQWLALISALVHAGGNSLATDSNLISPETMTQWIGVYDKVAFAAIGIIRVWFTGGNAASVLQILDWRRAENDAMQDGA